MKRICILLSACMILAFGMTAHGAAPSDAVQESEKREVEGDTLKKTVILPAGELTSIPRYETEGNILYVLDEDSLRLRTVSTGSAEGADMVTVTKIIAGLPDNDLERIPMTEKQGEVSCDLLYVSYKVTEESEEGMPLKYEALCWYGGLSKYEVDYDAAWEATMTYTGHPIESNIQSTVVEYIYEYENPPVEIGNMGGESTRPVVERQEAAPAETGNTETVEEEEVPMAAEEETEPELTQAPEHINIGDETTPLGAPAGGSIAAAAGAVAGGIFIAVLGYVYFLTVPIYAAVFSGGYKRIGRIRLKYQKDHYTAVLSEYLVEKAEVGNYKIKVSSYIQKRSKVGIIDIQCPDGKMITRKLEEEVLFTVM